MSNLSKRRSYSKRVLLNGPVAGLCKVEPRLQKRLTCFDQLLKFEPLCEAISTNFESFKIDLWRREIFVHTVRLEISGLKM